MDLDVVTGHQMLCLYLISVSVKGGGWGGGRRRIEFRL